MQAAPGSLEIGRSGDLGIWEFGIQTNIKNTQLSTSKFMLLKMKAWSGLAGETKCAASFDAISSIFPWAEQIKECNFCLPVFFGGPMGPIHMPYSSSSGPRCYPPEGGQSVFLRPQAPLPKSSVLSRCCKAVASESCAPWLRT